MRLQGTMIAVLSATLLSCGGGGGGQTPSPSPNAGSTTSTVSGTVTGQVAKVFNLGECY